MRSHFSAVLNWCSSIEVHIYPSIGQGWQLAGLDSVQKRMSYMGERSNCPTLHSTKSSVNNVGVLLDPLLFWNIQGTVAAKGGFLKQQKQKNHLQEEIAYYSFRCRPQYRYPCVSYLKTCCIIVCMELFLVAIQKLQRLQNASVHLLNGS